MSYSASITRLNIWRPAAGASPSAIGNVLRPLDDKHWSHSGPEATKEERERRGGLPGFMPLVTSPLELLRRKTKASSGTIISVNAPDNADYCRCWITRSKFAVAHFTKTVEPPCRGVLQTTRIQRDQIVRHVAQQCQLLYEDFLRE